MHIIGGKFKKTKLFSPKGDQTRPTKNILRETFFNICSPWIEEAVFADLFAGSGAMGLEALSRGAKLCYFIENHRNAYMAIEKNIELLHVQSQSILLKGNVFHSMTKIQHRCDIIFADPPYARVNQKSLAVILLEYLEDHILLHEGGRLFIEIGKEEHLNFELFKSLEHIRTKTIGSSQLVEFKQKIINP